MKRGPEDFALVGGTREFLSDLPVGQLYFPSWERYEAAIRDILERGPRERYVLDRPTGEYVPESGPVWPEECCPL